MVDKLKEKIDTYRNQLQDHIDKYGYAVQGVFGVKPGEPNFAYTVALSDSEAFTITSGDKIYTSGFEIITVCTMNANTLGWLINNVVYTLKERKQINLDTENLPTIATLKDGKTDLRMKLIPVPEDILEDAFKIRMGSKSNIIGFQLLIADKNNILPGEDGYDTTLNQDIEQVRYT